MKNVRSGGSSFDRNAERLFPMVGLAAGFGLLVGANACGHDWAGYDPRVDEPGAGGATSSASSSSPSSSSSTSASTGEGGAGGGMGGAGGASSASSSSGTGGMGGVPVCEPGVPIPCYTGPAGTLNVGTCKTGTLTCAADGTVFGTCQGDTVPKADTCGTAVDEDCNGMADEYCAIWAKRLGGAGDQRGTAVAVDADGSVVVAGYMHGNVNFGGGTLSSVGGEDVFVAKYQADGTFIWAKRFGSTADDEATGVTIDGMGNIIVIGWHDGTIGFGGTGDPTHPTVHWDDAFIAKLGPDGSYKWSRSWGGQDDQVPISVASDAAGNIVVGGAFIGDIDFGGGLTATSFDYFDGFVVRMDAAGTVAWAKTYGSWGFEGTQVVAITENGDVMVAGEYGTSVDFGMGSPTDYSGTDLFVARLDAAGQQIWLEGFGGDGDQWPMGGGLDAAGNFLIGGTYNYQIDFGIASYPAQGSSDVFALAVDPMGQPLWAKVFGDSREQAAWGARANPNGLVIAGRFKGTMDFGAGPPVVNAEGPDFAENDDIFVVNIGPNGVTKWAKAFGDVDDQDGFAAVSGPDGSVYLTGEIAGSANFGTGPITATSGNDAYLAKFPP